ncbi:MAG: hypothetical protein M1140_15425 [Chloroflexi bacterium]|nr:hypothetical protein [Chloroflexota bacterium]
MKLKQILLPLCAAAFACLVAACNANANFLTDVSVQPSVLTPREDGAFDMVRITYKISQPARVSIYLTDSGGARYSLRDDAERSASPAPYELLFNGVSNGRLLPDGSYTWHIDAKGQGRQQSFSGLLRISSADVPYPKISELTLSTNTISPNRDAIDDHTYINVVLAQTSTLSVYVVGGDGIHYEVQRMEGLRQITSDDVLGPGRYTYDYDGGINLGADPPQDGLYTVVAQTQDAIGQQDTITSSLTITQSGRPVAEIVTQPDGNAVEWSARGPSVVRAPTEANFITMGLGETLYFTMAVRNVGTVPIRTGGPFDPNDCYTMDQNRYTKGFVQESGAFRVGIDYDTNPGPDHPWRWGIGTLKDLDVVIHNGTKLYYLAPGKQVVVSGCIQMTKIPARNPFSVYASLIQEDVEIQPVNYHVSPVLIQLVAP